MNKMYMFIVFLCFLKQVEQVQYRKTMLESVKIIGLQKTWKTQPGPDLKWILTRFWVPCLMKFAIFCEKMSFRKRTNKQVPPQTQKSTYQSLWPFPGSRKAPPSLQRVVEWLNNSTTKATTIQKACCRLAPFHFHCNCRCWTYLKATTTDDLTQFFKQQTMIWAVAMLFYMCFENINRNKTNEPATGNAIERNVDTVLVI